MILGFHPFEFVLEMIKCLRRRLKGQSSPVQSSPVQSSPVHDNYTKNCGDAEVGGGMEDNPTVSLQKE